MDQKNKSYVDRMIEAMAPQDDTFEVKIVGEDGDVVNFPPVVFSVVRDYDSVESVAKAAAKFVKNYRAKKLPADSMKKMTEISGDFSDEVLLTAFTLAHYAVDKETWTFFEFAKLAKKLAWVFLHLDQGFRTHQMKALPEKDLSQFDSLKKA